MHVVVTGAAGGIGRRIVDQLTDRNASVLALDRRRMELPTAETRVVDLTETAAVDEILAGRPVDAVVTAAGWYAIGAIEDCSPAEFREHLEANLVTAHTTVRAALPSIRRRAGRIVVVGSVVGGVPLPYHGAYSAAKAGLDGYATALRRELRDHGVSVSLVEPGPTRTGLNERAAADRPDDGPYTAAYEQFRGYAPESVSPERVADAVVTALTADRPRARYRVGRRARWLPRVTALLPAPVADRLVAAGLPGGVLGRLVDR